MTELCRLDDLATERMTVREFLEFTCRNNPQVLASLFLGDPAEGNVFTIQANINIAVDARDARQAMRDLGFSISIPPAKKLVHVFDRETGKPADPAGD